MMLAAQFYENESDDGREWPAPITDLSVAEDIARCALAEALPPDDPNYERVERRRKIARDAAGDVAPDIRPAFDALVQTLLVEQAAKKLGAQPDMVRLAKTPDGAAFDAEWVKVKAARKAAGQPAADADLKKEVNRIRKAKGWNQEAKPARKKGLATTGKTSSADEEWAKGLYHVKFQNRVGRPGMKMLWTSESFSTQFAINDPRRPGSGQRVSPFLYVSTHVGFVETVDNAVYAAGLPETFEFRGMSFLNLYDPNSIPETAEEYDEESNGYVEVILSHVLLMCGGNEEYARMIISWMALNCRNPGEIIGWAILFKGVQGDGKSVLFDEVMSGILGSANHGLISSKEIASDFNSYSHGAAHRHIPELRATGRSRYETLDTLKPNITDPSVRMIGKKKDGDDIPNRTNFSGTTNHEDSLPLTDEDRRWFVMFTPWSSLVEMAEIVKAKFDLSLDEYFARLRKAARLCGPGLRKYLLEMELHPVVHHGSRAPMTIYKQRMIRSEYDDKGRDEFGSYVEDGCYCISKHVVTLSVLTAKLRRDLGREAPRQQQLVKLIKSRGYHKVDRVIKWKGKARSGVYVSDEAFAKRATDGEDIALAKVRSWLDDTVPKDIVKDPNDADEVLAYEERFFAALRPKHEF